jgi:hypothetical protein
VGRDDDRPSTSLLGPRPQLELGPVDLASPHFRSLVAFSSATAAASSSRSGMEWRAKPAGHPGRFDRRRALRAAGQADPPRTSRPREEACRHGSSIRRRPLLTLSEVWIAEKVSLT